MDASPQALLRSTCASQRPIQIRLQLSTVAWRGVGRIPTDLCAEMLDRIEFWSTGREPLYPQPGTPLQKRRHGLVLVYRVPIPQQDDWPPYPMQDVLEKCDHVVAG